MVQPRTLSLERLGYVAVCLLGLGPVLAVGLWRPLVVALNSDPSGLAQRLCVGAVLVAAIAVALSTWGSRRGRELAAASAAWGLGLVVGGSVAGPAGALSLVAVALACVWVTPRMLEALPSALDGAGRRHPVGALVWLLASAACVFATTRMSIFMADPAFVRYAAPPGATDLHYHLCFTAYVHAAELLEAGVDNVYDLALVPAEGLPETAAHMAPFELDRYGYPPQFLLVPLALTGTVEDFLAQRALWFGLNGLVFAWALWRLARWVGDRQGRVALLAAPFLWIFASVAFQVGNVQHVVLALGVLAMVAFEDKREILGGALLAAATLAKIAPGLLGVVLLVERRWRAAAWTVVFALLISGASLLVLGAGPFEAFFRYHLPRIASGEAYDFLDDSRMQILNNLAAFGIPFKLEASGVELDAWAVAPVFGDVLTVLAFAAAAVVGLRGRRRAADTREARGPGLERRARASMWLALLTLAALRSPMAPPYVMMGVLWALTFVAAELRGARAWAAWGGAVVLLLSQMPVAPQRPMWSALVGLVWMYLVLGWLVLRRWPTVDEARSPSC